MITHGLFQERACWILDSPALVVTVLEAGGHVASLRRNAPGSISPLWVQNRPTIDSDTFDPAIHGKLYGNDSEAKLISGLAGHNLCLPFWGDPTPAEYAAGMTFHGESNIVRWREAGSSDQELKISSELPESRLKVERSFRCEKEFVLIRTAVENLTAWDRPLAWCEHVTLGPPFLQPGITRFRASATRGFRTGFEAGPSFRWPAGRGEIQCDLQTFSPREHRDLVNSFLLDRGEKFGTFMAWNPDLNLVFGYRWPRQQFPWLNVWENHDARMHTRGMEFSNTPRHGTMRKLIQSPDLWRTPVYDWLDARGTITKECVAFLSGVPTHPPPFWDCRSGGRGS